MGLRRTLLISTGALALGGAGVWAAFIQEGSYRTGQARLMPPLLRARFGTEDRLYGMVRRREEEVLPSLSLRTPDAGDRFDLCAWNAATLEPIFTAPLISVASGDNGEAGILGEQNATIWIHIGGIGAASAVDGRMLADMAGILARNAALSNGMPESRAAFRFETGLEFTDAMRSNWRIDPRNFNVTPARSAPVGALAMPQASSPWVSIGIRGQAQVQAGGTWFGLLDAAATVGDPRQPRPGTGPARLWRTVAGGADAPTPPSAPAPIAAGKPPVPSPQPDPAAPRASDSALVPVEDGPLFDAMLLAEVRLASGTPGVLLLYRAASGAPFRLARIGADGTIAWRTALPLASVNTLMPGEAALVLAGRKAGTDATTGTEAIASLDLATGALRARDIATNAAISA